jgi:hypothetical protein
MPEMPETRFTKVGDIDIAYQVIGRADGLDLVFVPGWVSHLEVMWELPEFARFLDRLAAMGRLLCSTSAAPVFLTGSRASRLSSGEPTTSPLSWTQCSLKSCARRSARCAEEGGASRPARCDRSPGLDLCPGVWVHGTG